MRTNFLFSYIFRERKVSLHIDLWERIECTSAKSPTGIKPDVLALFPLRHLRRRCYRRPVVYTDNRHHQARRIRRRLGYPVIECTPQLNDPPRDSGDEAARFNPLPRLLLCASFVQRITRDCCHLYPSSYDCTVLRMSRTKSSEILLKRQITQ